MQDDPLRERIQSPEFPVNGEDPLLYNEGKVFYHRIRLRGYDCFILSSASSH